MMKEMIAILTSMIELEKNALRRKGLMMALNVAIGIAEADYDEEESGEE